MWPLALSRVSVGWRYHTSFFPLLAYCKALLRSSLWKYTHPPFSSKRKCSKFETFRWIKQKFRTPNSKSKLGKRENHEKQTFGSWLMVATVCFQAPRIAPVKFVAVSSDGQSVWRWWRFGVKEERRTTICVAVCGGLAWRKRWEQRFVWWYVAVVEVRREGRDEKSGMAWRKQRKLWALNVSFLRLYCRLKWSLTWRGLIGWRKTLVLHQLRT